MRKWLDLKNGIALVIIVLLVGILFVESYWDKIFIKNSQVDTVINRLEENKTNQEYPLIYLDTTLTLQRTNYGYYYTNSTADTCEVTNVNQYEIINLGTTDVRLSRENFAIQYGEDEQLQADSIKSKDKESQELITPFPILIPAKKHVLITLGYEYSEPVIYVSERPKTDDFMTKITLFYLDENKEKTAINIGKEEYVSCLVIRKEKE